MRSLLIGCVGAAAVGSTAALGPKRALLDAGSFTVNKLGLVDLSSFPMDARGVVDAGQTVQASGLGIEVQENTTPSFGTYKLSPAAAAAVSDAITALVPFPAAACCLLLSHLGRTCLLVRSSIRQADLSVPCACRSLPSRRRTG